MTKKLNALATLFAVFMLLSVSSCRSDSDSSVLSRVPADANMAYVLNLHKIVESGGGELSGSKFRVPAYLYGCFDIDSAKCAEVVEKFGKSGLNADEIAVWQDDRGDNYVVLGLESLEKFESFASENKIAKRGASGDYTFYARTDGSSNFALNDKFVYIYDHSLEESAAAKTFDAAAGKPLADTEFGRYALKGNAGGAVFNVKGLAARLGSPLEIPANCFLCARLDLEGDEAEATMVLMSENGSKIRIGDAELKFDPTATISANALAYISPTECMVYAVALKNVDWDAIFDNVSSHLNADPLQRMVFGMVKEYFKKIDGTVAIGIGVDGSADDFVKMRSGASPLTYLPLTLVIETVPGKAKGFLGDIQALLASTGIRPTDLPDGFSVPVPHLETMLYGKVDGNTVIFSTRQIEKYSGDAFSDLKGNFAGVGLNIPADYPLARDLNVKDNLKAGAVADLKDAEGEISVKITGATSGGIVERMIRLLNAYDKGLKTIQAKEALSSDFTPLETEPDSDEDWDF